MVLVAEDDGTVIERASSSFVPPTSADTDSKPAKSTTTVGTTDPLSTFAFVTVWTLLLVLHALCASYLLAMAMLYFFMENPFMAYYANLLALPEHRYFRLFGTLVGILGGLHGLQLVLHLFWSIKARAPAVFPRAAMVHHASRSFQELKKKKVQPTTSRSSRSRNSISVISSFATSRLRDALSVEGSHFALVFMIRKAAEASAQIVQCHRYSTLIGRVWINQAYTAMVVTNCWISPMLDYLMLTADSRAAKQTSKRTITKYNIVPIRERVVCVTVDTLLTTFACLILPLSIFVPYARQFDADWYGFPTELLYGDVSFPNLIRENQALFALNFLDAVTKLVPHISISFGMASISLILELYAPARFKCKQNAVATTTVAVRAKKRSSRTLSAVAKQTSTKHRVSLTFFRRVIAPITFVAAGGIVLGLHLHAAYLASTADASTMKMCLQGLQPWFAVNVSCSVLEYNCYQHGVISPPSTVLDHLQNDAVTAVVFEHCAEFRMPHSIRRFPNLLGLELWNVSIVEWGSSAALSADLHPNMIFLVMAYTNMTEMPRGLLTKPLPPLLGDIEISITNLTLIPDELADAWANVRLVYLEHTPLKEFPTAFFKIPSLSVSLLDDALETVPDDLFTAISLLDEYLEVCFSYNPIKSLPPSIREGLLINYLSIDHTNLTELPAWTDTIGQWIDLGGAPICNNSEAKLSAITSCYDGGWDPIANGRYPLNLVQQYRLIQDGS